MYNNSDVCPPDPSTINVRSGGGGVVAAFRPGLRSDCNEDEDKVDNLAYRRFCCIVLTTITILNSSASSRNDAMDRTNSTIIVSILSGTVCNVHSKKTIRCTLPATNTRGIQKYLYRYFPTINKTIKNYSPDAICCTEHSA